jgi:MFS family permease
MQPATPTRRRAILIYVLPAAVDLVLGIVLFVATLRAAQMGGETLRSAAVLTVWSLAYVVAVPIVGRIVKPANASRFVMGGICMFAAACGLLALVSSFVLMLILVGAIGVAAALFFPPFQVFMKDVDAAGGRSLAASTGLYTFAWSAGYACGPLVSGFLMQLGGAQGWRLAYILGAGVCVLLTIVLVRLDRSRAHKPSASVSDPDPVAVDTTYAAKLDLAWLGWIAAGAGLIAVSMIRSIFPARALGVLRFPEGSVGALFFTLSATQALAGLALARSRTWMYRPLPVAGFALVGLAGILCFGLGSTLPVLLAGAVLAGVYIGSFYFFLVFHALVHPSRAARHVSVNELVVGATGFLAPLAAGSAADLYGFRVPFLAACGLILAVTVFQAWVLGRKRAG